MDNYSLIVLDYQPHFKAARIKSNLYYCKLEIKKAISNNVPIIFVEYIGAGNTIKSLRDLTNSYTKVFTIIKHSDSGAKELAEVLNSINSSTKLVFCGVNTDLCVYDTISDLNFYSESKSDFEIQVIAKACNSEYSHQNGLTKLKALNKVKII